MTTNISRICLFWKSTSKKIICTEKPFVREIYFCSSIKLKRRIQRKLSENEDHEEKSQRLILRKKTYSIDCQWNRWAIRFNLREVSLISLLSSLVLFTKIFPRILFSKFGYFYCSLTRINLYSKFIF